MVITDLPKSVGAMATPVPPGMTGLALAILGFIQLQLMKFIFCLRVDTSLISAGPIYDMILDTK